MTGTEADHFYLPVAAEQVSQGDLFLVPTCTAWAAESRADSGPAAAVAFPPRIGASVLTRAWEESAALERGVSSTAVETRWGPALILSHDCEIDKDFNEEVDRLIAEEGLPESDAIQIASRNPDLDGFVTVAPLLSYGEIPEHKHPGIRSGQRIGYFPLQPIPGFGTAEYAVHLTRIATVDRQLLTSGLKVASLEPEMVRRLQYKVAECLVNGMDLQVVAPVPPTVEPGRLRR